MNVLTPAAITWLEARGLDSESAAAQGIYSVRHPRHGETLALPYRLPGHAEAVNHKYRALDTKAFWQDTDGRQCFWNYEVLKDPKVQAGQVPLVITEGELDALAFITSNWPYVVSVPNGAPPELEDGDEEPDPESIDPETDTRYRYLWDAWRDLKDIKRIVLATDDDPPGHRLRQELAARLGRARCSFIDWPEGCKDANAVLLEHGGPELVMLLHEAKPWPIQGLFELADFPEVPYQPVYYTGIPALDRRFLLRRQNFTIVTGIPGHGKSTFITRCLVNVCARENLRVAVASFEKPVVPYYRDELRRMYLGKAHTDCLPEHVAKADKWIADHFVFIEQTPDWNGPDQSLEWVLEKAREAVLRYGVAGVLLDPWNEVEHKRGKYESETDYIGRCIRAMRRFARQYSVVFIVVAHPTKPDSRNEDKPPTLYSVAGSAHWYNKCDQGLVVHRPCDDAADIHVIKSRYLDAGRPGKTALTFYEDDLNYR